MPRARTGAVVKLRAADPKTGRPRFSVRYVGPDGRRYTDPRKFSSATSARAALSGIMASISEDRWENPAVKPAPVLTFADYAASWMAASTRKPKTDKDYTLMLKAHLLPTFGATPLGKITAVSVSAWYACLLPGKPTARAHVYSLLRTILNDAIRVGLIDRNPCTVRGGGSVRRESVTELPDNVDVSLCAEFMPPAYRLLVYLAAACGLRSGEARALQRGDIDMGARTITIRRNLVHLAGGETIGTPKTRAGNRVVAIPSWLAGVVAAHLAAFVGPRDDAWLFPGPHGGMLADGTMADYWHKARESAGVPSLRYHDLRHYAATMAVINGASDYEAMAMLGHEDSKVLRRYLDTVKGRAHAIADSMPSLVRAA